MKAVESLEKERPTKSQPKAPAEREFKTLLRAGIQQVRTLPVRAWLAEHFPLPEERVEWRDLAKTFLKLGATGFGGGIAVISQIRRLVVRERRWMSEGEFLDAVSLCASCMRVPVRRSLREAMLLLHSRTRSGLGSESGASRSR